MIAPALTARRREILNHIRHVIATKGYPPTKRELCLHFGWKSVNAARGHLRALERHGAIKLDRGASRGIRVMEFDDDPIPHTPLKVTVVGTVGGGGRVKWVGESSRKQRLSQS